MTKGEGWNPGGARLKSEINFWLPVPRRAVFRRGLGASDWDWWMCSVTLLRSPGESPGVSTSDGGRDQKKNNRRKEPGNGGPGLALGDVLCITYLETRCGHYCEPPSPPPHSLSTFTSQLISSENSGLIFQGCKARLPGEHTRPRSLSVCDGGRRATDCSPVRDYKDSGV